MIEKNSMNLHYLKKKIFTVTLTRKILIVITDADYVHKKKFAKILK